MLSKTFLFIAAAHAASGLQLPWLYTEIDGRGPSGWKSISATCQGTKQSPININNAVVDNTLLPLHLHYSVTQGLNVTNVQHTIQAIPRNNDKNYLEDTNNLKKKYNLQQLNFHSPSEHTIGGSQFDFEVQLVHKLNDNDGDLDALESHKYVIISVLFRETNTPNSHFNFFNNLPSVPMPKFDNLYTNDTDYTAVSEILGDVQLDLQSLVGRKYYTYSGSWTRPPCTEAVRWYVMQEPLTISSAQVDFFRKAMGFGDLLTIARDDFDWGPKKFQYFGNNRPTQSLNSRTVRKFADAKYEQDDHSIAWKTGVAGIVIASFAALLAIGAIIVVMVIRSGPPTRRTKVVEEEMTTKSVN